MNEVVDVILSKDADLQRHQVFGKKLLDVEPLYEANGYEVEFIKQPYYDSSPDVFIFKAKKQGN